MEYRTKCRLCESPISVTVKDEDAKACKEVGHDPQRLLELVVCDDCRFFKETGYKRPPQKPLFHFL